MLHRFRAVIAYYWVVVRVVAVWLGGVVVRVQCVCIMAGAERRFGCCGLPRREVKSVGADVME